MFAVRAVAKAQRQTRLAQMSSVRFYKSRLTEESYFEGKNLVQTAPDDASSSSGQYVVADATPAPIKVAAGVKLIGFKYPNASAPNNKTFYAVAPRKPPAVLTGIAGEYVEKLYLASNHTDELMKTEQQLQEFVLPLSSDDEIEKKFFSNPTIENVEKRKAIQTFAEQNKLSVIVTALLNEVIEHGHSEHLREIVNTYSDLMKRLRCEATAEVTFGRIPTLNEAARVQQLVTSLRSPTQYYVHQNILIDPGMGGGLVVRMGDFELDGSLTTRTSEVHKHLVKSLQH